MSGCCFDRLGRVIATVAGWVATSAMAVAQEAPVAARATAEPLSVGGWAFMLLSLAFVWVMTLWCFKLVLTTPSPTDPGPAAKP